jgi:hypothetical protein
MIYEKIIKADAFYKTSAPQRFPYSVEAKYSIACFTSSCASGFMREKYKGIVSRRYALSNVSLSFFYSMPSSLSSHLNMQPFLKNSYNTPSQKRSALTTLMRSASTHWVFNFEMSVFFMIIINKTVEVPDKFKYRFRVTNIRPMLRMLRCSVILCVNDPFAYIIFLYKGYVFCKHIESTHGRSPRSNAIAASLYFFDRNPYFHDGIFTVALKFFIVAIRITVHQPLLIPHLIGF